MKKCFLMTTMLLILALFGSSCQSEIGATSSPQQPVPTSDIIFMDDFTYNTTGWSTWSDERGIVNYENGAMRILVNEPNALHWTNPGLTFEDVKIEVDATKQAGPDENDFGVICRHQDEQNMYFFVISSDGYFGIGKLKGGEEMLIGMDKFGFDNQTIRAGQATNHLRVDCIGSKLTLYVNDKKLAEVEDSDFPLGDVGLLAGSYDTPGVDILFDNFVVREP
jgi:hypothetical protein